MESATPSLKPMMNPWQMPLFRTSDALIDGFVDEGAHIDEAVAGFRDVRCNLGMKWDSGEESTDQHSAAQVSAHGS